MMFDVMCVVTVTVVFYMLVVVTVGLMAVVVTLWW